MDAIFLATDLLVFRRKFFPPRWQAVDVQHCATKNDPPASLFLDIMLCLISI
jgi:hypothetical protein